MFEATTQALFANPLQLLFAIVAITAFWLLVEFFIEEYYGLKKEERETDGIWRKYRRFIPHFVLIIFYFLLGIALHCGFKGKTFVQALFFQMTTFTTIGYDNEEPQTSLEFILGFLNVFFGVGIVGTGITLLLEFIMEERQRNAEFEGFKLESEKHAHFSFWESCWFKLLVWATFLFGGAGVVGSFEGWNFWECMYWGIVTGSTVGFGDIVPCTVAGQILTCIYAPIAIVLTVQTFTIIYDLTKFQNEDEIFKKKARKFSQYDPDKLDIDGDGFVSKEEFCLQVLIKEYNIDHEQVSLVFQIFEEKKRKSQNRHLETLMKKRGELKHLIKKKLANSSADLK